MRLDHDAKDSGRDGVDNSNTKLNEKQEVELESKPVSAQDQTKSAMETLEVERFEVSSGSASSPEVSPPPATG